ncbi:P-loop containing nucleoside triphosphate hydrolase protein [Yamadazyma tenuis ATCC 10573]|uniref:Origin recognition complex subunit 1 n=1 Tax=Candida tenuis (strain ATCC 10573 / BCRC 21748 / CBS 615 / JCM 9827 / NBRC 10315 / NRRL Y-1498 / VKM Y-70) TaxID=590646 RepID=G3AY54_CANTC|nr:P-loop containing nucleoside triphosphate hydrolase protein [Yamadazyma tenuis ATCC 10573]EGV65772.1 P-loop containing nucleoside triphosphate hydrolase protein [Yamadazyma tenuis ATCC 10573]
MLPINKLKGWTYSFLESEDNGDNESPRRSGRRRGAVSNKIMIKRDKDGLELKAGDSIEVQQQKISDTQIALIISIEFGISSVVKLEVLWFNRSSEIDLTINSDRSLEEKELFITPFKDIIPVDVVKENVNVMTHEAYMELSKKEHRAYFCRMASDEDGQHLSQPLSYDVVLATLKQDPKTLVELIGDMTEENDKKQRTETPTQKRNPEASESASQKARQSEKKLINISSEESDSEDDRDVEEIDLDSSDEEFHSAQTSPKKRRATSKPTTPRKTSLRKPRAPPQNDRGFQESEEFMKKVLGRKVMIYNSLPVPTLSSPKKRTKKNDSTYGNLDTSSTAFKDLKKKLHTSAKLSSLPCREDEFTTLYLNVENSIKEQTGCCLYISGTPGIGKTATIQEVMSSMEDLKEKGEVNDFDYVEINALKLINPNYAYSVLWSKISGLDVSPSYAALFLDAYFKEDSPSKKPIVVMVDELDSMATKKQNVMYNFFNWPTYPNSKLIVLAVANTMDLPERVLTNKISSRLGMRRIQFIGYTFEQLGCIIDHRLSMIQRQSKQKVIIESDAINFASRKVASVSGDARRALQICRRAVEIAELEYQTSANGDEHSSDVFHVKIPHIAKAINESTNSPIAQYVASLSMASKLILCALLLRQRRSGLAENPLGDIIDEIKILLRMASSKSLRLSGTISGHIDVAEALLDGRMTNDQAKTSIRIENFKFLIFELIENGILNAQDIKSERYRLVSLNVSQDEVMSTLKRDDQVSGFL